MNTQPPEPTDPDVLLQLYKIAIEEYRFQVTLNWNRTQYYFVLNVGVIALATGILNLSDHARDWMVAAIYCVGLLCCGLSFLASRVQTGYYQTARDHKRVLEQRLGLGTLALSTTPGMGSALRRLGKVTTFNAVLLGALAVVNVIGIGFALIE